MCLVQRRRWDRQRQLAAPPLPSGVGDVKARGAQHLIQNGVGDRFGPHASGISGRTAVGHVMILLSKVA